MEDFENDPVPESIIDDDKYSSAQYKTKNKMYADNVTEGYLRDSQQEPELSDASIINISSIQHASYQMRQNQINLTENDDYKEGPTQQFNKFSINDNSNSPTSYFQELSLKAKIMFFILCTIIFFLCVGLGVQGGKYFRLGARLKNIVDDEDFQDDFN